MTPDELKKNVLESLTYARSLLVKGWVKGDLCTDDEGKKAASAVATRFCTLGAIHRAVQVNFPISLEENKAINLKVYNETYFYIANSLPEGFPSVPRFNDRPETVLGDVLAVFDRAIKLVE